MDDYESINKSAYDLNADYFSNMYNKNNPLVFADIKELLGMFACRSRTVLDLGSGNGFFAKLFSLYGINVTCLDNSTEMLEKCGSNKILASLESIPLNDESVEGVFANCSFLHLPKIKFPAALEETHRVLMKYGTFYIAMKTGDEFEGFVEAAGIKRFQSIYDKDDLIARVGNYFNIIESKPINFQDKIFLALLCIKP